MSFYRVPLIKIDDDHAVNMDEILTIRTEGYSPNWNLIFTMSDSKNLVVSYPTKKAAREALDAIVVQARANVITEEL